MKNIGPYLDETIDFTKLDNMFLIKGDTGAGKIFIFDSMTYALYGKLRGNREDHESAIKSRYAQESDESFVEFTFEIAGKTYRINRTVPFKYTNRNGKTAKKTQEASLEEFVRGRFNPIEGKLSDINEKIHDLLGLSADEFAKIVVLPQGEFAEFLHQNTNDRMKTLEKLFPVEFYAGITKRVKEKCDAENQKLRDCTSLIASLSQSRNFENASEEISRMETEIQEFDKREQKLLQNRTETAKKLEALKHEKQAAEEYEENCQKLQNLESQKQIFDALSQTIAKADKAKGLREFIHALDIAEQTRTQAQENYASAVEKKASLEKTLDALNAKKAQMQKLKEQNEKDGQELSLLQEKLKNAAGLDALKKENALALEKKQEAEAQKNEIAATKAELERQFEEKNIAQILTELSQSVKELSESRNQLENEKADCKKRDELIQKQAETKKALEAATEKLEAENEKEARTKQTLEELEARKKEDDEKNQAYAVSVFLTKGSPCPVCGSLEHPSPAKKPEGLLDYSEQIKTQKGNLDSLRTLIQRYREDCAKLEESQKSLAEQRSQISTERALAEVEAALDSVAEQILQAESQQEKIQTVSAKLGSLEKDLKDAQEKLEQANLSYTNTLTQIQTLEKSLGEPLEILHKKEEALAAELLQNRKTFDSWEEQFNQTSRDFSAAEAAVTKYQSDVENSGKQVAKAEKALGEHIASSDFASVEEAKAANLTDSELEEKRKSQNEYNEVLKSARDAVNAGKDKKLKKLSDIVEEFERNSKKEREIEADYAEVHETLAEKRTFFTEYKSDFEKIRDAQDRKIVLEKELEPLNALNDNLSGKNPQKLPLESWALGMYFEQVVAFASKRFNDISDGRFFFKFKQPEDAASGNGFRGLDLLVLDTHNGKTSDPAELSGGETFEASISLALAITDVVQNNNGGGIQLDSLFIDEGFGTLDPETLEKAMAVLTELGETKMIGMISHVAEMENYPSIHSSITVNKSNTGSTVTVGGV